jgi:hypothetical protein
MSLNRKQVAALAILQKNGIVRSSRWDKVQRAFRAAHPQCAACGETAEVNIHHQFPFHYVVGCGRPDLELDPRNLVTLCVQRGCQHHLLLGHLNDWESYNPFVKTYVRRYAGQTSPSIRDDAGWKKAVAARPKHLDRMTVSERAALKARLDKKFPPQSALMMLAINARAEMNRQPPLRKTATLFASPHKPRVKSGDLRS